MITKLVYRAYNDNVPHKLSEQDFWKRYFKSQMFRQSNQGAIESTHDKLFDGSGKANDKEINVSTKSKQKNDVIEPKVNRIIDVDANEGDHFEVKLFIQNRISLMTKI